MAPRKKGKSEQRALRPQVRSLIVTLKYRKSRKQSLAVKETCNGYHENGDGGQQENSMVDLNQGAFHGTRSHTMKPHSQSPFQASPAPAHPSTGSTPSKIKLRFFNRAAQATAEDGLSPVKARPKSALKRERNHDDAAETERPKKVARIDDVPQIFSVCTWYIFHLCLHLLHSLSFFHIIARLCKMSEARPKLKLSFSRIGQPTDPTTDAAQSPPPSAIRTPSIKLNFAKPAQPSPSDTASTPKIKKPKPVASGTPTSAKKRKRTEDLQDEDKEVANKRPSPQRKLTLKTKPVESIPQPLVRAPTGLKLQYKGKIKKREAGSGWDSELEDSERDPVIIDGFVLRMQPGEDCDYLQDHLAKGTLGHMRTQGGPDIRFSLFDVHGRRGIMHVRE